jgi:hypothetical protein
MASRAVVINYNVASLDPSGDVVLEIKAIYADTIDPTKTKVLTSSAMLDVANPAGWPASIRDAIVSAGVATTFPDLTTAGCFIPTYS